MVKTTLIARVTDGLPLAASMDDEEVGAAYSQASQAGFTHNSCTPAQTEDLTPYKNQAKQLFKQLSANVEDSRCSVETGPYVFQCVLHISRCFARIMPYAAVIHAHAAT